MFDSLPEGIIVMHHGKINFINDLAQKLLSHVSGMYHFGNNFKKEGIRPKIDNIDQKVFYVFKYQTGTKESQGAAKKKKKKKWKKNANSESSKTFDEE